MQSISLQTKTSILQIMRTFIARLQPRDKAAMLVEKLIQNGYIQREREKERKSFILICQPSSYIQKCKKTRK